MLAQVSTACLAATAPQILKALGQQIRQCETARRSQWRETFSSGQGELDRLLPAGGFGRGTLVEWLMPRGGGAGTLALVAGWQACRDGRALVVVDRRQMFYPPAAASLGIDLERLIVVRPSGPADEAWAIDQSLRCPGVGAMLCWPQKLDDHTFRRWQLAAEEGATLGMLVRPQQDRSQPSWAELRLLVTPLRAAGIGRRVRIDVLRCHGAKVSEPIELEIDTLHTPAQTYSQVRHESHPLPVVSGVASAAALASAAGAGRSPDRAL